MPRQRRAASNPTYFKTEFDRLAVNGAIGRPDGLPAYAYLRVSSDEQADEGRGGLPRQIANIASAAAAAGYAITWDRVYADDCSGFELDRPLLTALRSELRRPARAGAAVVIEHLDRLSRNADWHQGYLIDEFKQAGVTIVFWRSFSSRVERAVMGAIAQDAMEQARQRQTEGKLHKARSGRVTASSPAYGYRFVDEHGQESPRATRHTHYGIKDTEAAIVRRIFSEAVTGRPMAAIAAALTAEGVPPPKNNRTWWATQIRVIIRSEVYKGDYYAHRWQHVKEQRPAPDGIGVVTISHKVEYPRDQWIHVPVPPLVTPEVWVAANDILQKNKAAAARNNKGRYLLTGLIFCADCGRAVNGHFNKGRNERQKDHMYYACITGGKRQRKAERGDHHCTQGHIKSQIVDNAVWSVIAAALLDPDLLIKAIEKHPLDDANRQRQQQAAYIDQQITDKAAEGERIYAAYAGGVFDLEEFAARRAALKGETERLQTELAALLAAIVTPEQIAGQIAAIRAAAARIRSVAAAGADDLPADLKRRIVRMVISRVELDQRQQTIRLTGAIAGSYQIVNDRNHRGIHNRLTYAIEYSLTDGAITAVRVDSSTGERS